MPFSPSIPATPLSPVTLVMQIRFAPRLDLRFADGKGPFFKQKANVIKSERLADCVQRAAAGFRRPQRGQPVEDHVGDFVLAELRMFYGAAVVFSRRSRVRDLGTMLKLVRMAF
jgi:hypothetical protein